MNEMTTLEQAISKIQNIADYTIYFETQPKNWYGKTPLRNNNKFPAEKLLRKWQHRDNRCLYQIPKDMDIIWNIAIKHEHSGEYIRVPQNKDKAYTFLDLMRALDKHDSGMVPKEYTGVCDKNNIPIYLTNAVRFSPTGETGCVGLNFGAYGIEFQEPIDWDKIEHVCNQKLHACFNDNFISFWEIAWNFDDEDDILTTVELVP